MPQARNHLRLFFIFDESINTRKNMSHSPLRTEKDCLNCGTTVEDRYCPHCGQENIVNRPSFHHLFTHFFADLFHYDSGFWKTITTLLFKPGRIVKEYLEGKRKTYMQPVKLYIFVSFVAFFLPHFLPDFRDKYEDKEQETELLDKANEDFEGLEVAGIKNVRTVEQLDSIQNSLPQDQKISQAEYFIMKNTLDMINSGNGERDDNSRLELDIANFENFKIYREGGVSMGKNYQNIKTLNQFDSIHHSLPSEKKLNWVFAKVGRKAVELQEREVYKNENLIDKFKESFVGNLPKALFFYLPFFAFSLWLLHGKKRWMYYDHGIFTLYFFSALLIFITLLNLISSFISIPLIWWEGFMGTADFLGVMIGFAFFIYISFYFFRAHHRVYEESAWISRLKCFVLLFFNNFLLFFVLLMYTLFTFMMI